MTTQDSQDSKEQFSERSPENLEKYIDLVEQFQAQDMSFEGDTGKVTEPSGAGRVPTANRMRYDVEVGVIKRQIGDLEEIRSKIGLSRRKMAQLLLVDPSAWTRWSKTGAPPHVYRALEWYMLLTKEVPAQAHSYWIATVGGRTQALKETNRIQELSEEVLRLKQEYARFKRSTVILLGAILLSLICAGFVIRFF